MKKSVTMLMLAAGIVVLLSGCTVRHFVAPDYPVYLSKNEGTGTLPKTQLQADYRLTEATTAHHLEFRSATAGYANLWIVEFGQMLDASLASKDVQQSFGRLTRQSGSGPAENLITFDLKEYAFSDFGAHVALNVSLEKNGQRVSEKTYQADGKTQGGKVFWGGVFAMKNAIQQSTRIAIDDILKQFINDTGK